MFNGVLALICGSRQKNAPKMSLIPGLLLYPGLLYPGLTLCCSIVQSTGNRKVALISGLLLYPGLLYPGLTLYCSIVRSTRNRKVALISGFDCNTVLLFLKIRYTCYFRCARPAFD